MAKYSLIAFDMDGTLLDSRKRISEGTLQAVREAVRAGKAVVLSTGRPLSALAPYRHQLGSIRYGVLSSGAVLYDFQEERVLARSVFGQEELEALEPVTRQEDIMPLVMENGRIWLEEGSLQRLPHYRMEAFGPLYRETAGWKPDIRAFLLTGGEGFEKINLFHTDAEAKARTRARLSSLPLELADSEETSLEVSPAGICKGNGLLRLCDLLGVPAGESIAVGDSDNDLTMIKAAGLGVAMGNANHSVKAAAKAEVSDCDHDGCAEAIRRFLLS